jgi:hypothetical protein
MSWFRSDDAFWRHRKVRKLGRAKVTVTAQVACAGLWQLAGTWSSDNISDGFVPREQVEQWDPRLQLAARLVDAGLWHETTVDDEDGYRFHDWHDYNPSAAEVDEKRAKRAAAGRRGGVKSGESRRSKTEANASPTVQANANPVPTPIGTTHPDKAAPEPNTREREQPEPDREPIPTGPAITGPTAVSAKHLVQRHIGPEFPAAVRTALAIEIGQLITQYPEPLLVQALNTWKTRTGIGPRILPNLVADLVKEQTNGLAYGVRSSGSGARSARSEKVAAILAAGDVLQAELDAGQLEAGSLRVIEGGRSA